MGRSIRFGMLLNLDERQMLVKLAEFEGGLSLGAMIRHLIRDQAREHDLWQPALRCRRMWPC